MRLLRHPASVALALLVCAGSARAQSDDLAGDVAARSRALAELFTRLSSPERAQALVDAIAAGDAEAYNRVFDGIEAPVRDKCYWISGVIDSMAFETTYLEEECTLRSDLSPEEATLYLKIAMRHRQLVTPEDAGSLQLGPGNVIPPGPFLDELKAHNLVKCEQRMKYDLTIKALHGAEKFCWAN